MTLQPTEARYGPNSSEYEQAGGTRRRANAKSERLNHLLQLQNHQTRELNSPVGSDGMTIERAASPRSPSHRPARFSICTIHDLRFTIYDSEFTDRCIHCSRRGRPFGLPLFLGGVFSGGRRSALTRNSKLVTSR